MNLAIVELEHCSRLLQMAADERRAAAKHEALSGAFHVEQAQRHAMQALSCQYAARRMLTGEYEPLLENVPTGDSDRG